MTSLDEEMSTRRALEARLVKAWEGKDLEAAIRTLTKQISLAKLQRFVDFQEVNRD